jgi:hypothetical protein
MAYVVNACGLAVYVVHKEFIALYLCDSRVMHLREHHAFTGAASGIFEGLLDHGAGIDAIVPVHGVNAHGPLSHAKMAFAVGCQHEAVSCSKREGIPALYGINRRLMLLFDFFVFRRHGVTLEIHEA